MLFDSHAHYDDSRYDIDRFELLETINNEGVAYILNAGATLESSIAGIELAERFNFMYASVGVHPHDAQTMDDNTLIRLSELADHEKVVAFGEIGLDYYYDNSPRELQRCWFAKQLDLAYELNLPVIIHVRDAFEDTLEIVKKLGANHREGIIHCFSGSIETAREFLKRNYTISVGGALTFKNARKVREVAAYVPEDMLLIETDCPYLSPEPHRGERNHSGYLRYIASKLADIRNITYDEAAAVTLKNAKRVFNII